MLLGKKIIRPVVTHGRSTSNVKRSQFATAIRKVQHLLRLGTSSSVKDGRLTSFWWDRWCGNNALQARYPCLFAISEKPNARAADQWLDSMWRTRLRCSVEPEEAADWQQLRQELSSICLLVGPHKVTWRLEPSGKFSTGTKLSSAMAPVTASAFGVDKYN